jgi:putative restriction endonuclease
MSREPTANPAHRIASQIKPWTCSDNRERLDGQNGLLLTSHVDHLFDKGLTSFAVDGLLLISPVADREALRQMGIPVDSPLHTRAAGVP